MKRIRGTYTNRVYSKINACRQCGVKFHIGKGYRSICSDECKRLRLNEYRRKLYDSDIDKSRELNKQKRLKNPTPYKAIQDRYSRKVGRDTREEWIKKQPRGSEHHWWSGGSKTEMSARLNDKKWQKIRVQVWKRDGFKCQHCCKQLARGLKPITHHIVPWRETQDDSMDNLVTLCNSCHLKEHHRLRQLQKEMA